MRSLFGSLTFRIGLAFLVGLVLLQIVIAVAVIWPDGRPAIFRLVAPEQASAMARALEAVREDQRDLVIAALNSGPLIVHLQAAFPEEGRASPDERAPYLAQLYGRYAAALGGRPFTVAARGDAAMANRGDLPERGGAVRLLVQLHTGETLVIERAPVLLQRIIARFAVIGGAAALIMVLVMLYCVHQVVLPARRLAEAARALAIDTDQPDLRMRGPTEIRMLSGAFNDMKRTISALMNERTRVLAAIAHDLRTYLTRLRLRAEFIDDSHQQAQAVRDLDDMNLLLDDTLIFARETTASRLGQRERVDARSEIERLAATRQEMGQPVACSTTDAEPLLTRCDPLALRRMLANLTDNAVRYGKAAHVSGWREGGVVRIAVEDDGPGVPPEAIARLTEPFERLEPSRGRSTGGAGLGLAIVKALAKSQGGDLTIENRRTGGLRAVISLPACD